MKQTIVLLWGGLMLWSCTKTDTNPFFAEFDTPFQVPPFEQIEEEHFMPAFTAGMDEQRQEIEAIANNPAEPTFENTLEAMEKSGRLLTRVSRVFFNLRSAHTNDQIQQIARDVSPLLSKHRDDIMLNEKLFTRIRNIHSQKADLALNPEQDRLLDEYYQDFVRSGANLDEQQKEELRKINQELSLLTLRFGENVLKEDNAFELVLEDEADLAGLPENVITGAAEAARAKGYEGKWLFTLHKPSLIPFLQYSEKRDLREKMFKGYINRGDNDNEFDNKDILRKIVALRIQKAELLGYDTHGAYILDRNMAKNADNVYQLLNQLWPPALKRAKEEAADMQAIINREGGNFKLQPWDWWYYAEKVKKEKYDLDEEMLRPYFKLENVRDGAFMLANKLFGITFEQLTGMPLYHEDVEVFEVKDEDGSHIGILYTDYFPRASKSGGAWMNNYREQSAIDGEMIRPVISNVGNFSKPAGDIPALLSVDEVGTLFHEFGHGLHGLLSQCTYPRLSGTSVKRDFVELHSQIMENWAFEPQMLKLYARHYQTDDPIPDALIEKINRARLFNQGFATVEYLAAAFLDMDWHTLTEAPSLGANEFEKQALDEIGLMPEIVSRYRSPHFRHIFAGGYSAGYYNYIWAEVLDADAFQAFKETDLFSRETGMSFRRNILESGGTEDPMVLYTRFRGKEPSVEPLLKRRGLN